MKNQILNIVFVSLFLIAGVATVLAEIEQKTVEINHEISPQDLVIVQDLFNKNNLNIDDFQILKLKIDSKYTDNPQAGYYVVKANRVYNGLRFFMGGDVIYHFNKEGSKVFEAGSVSDNIGEISPNPLISKEDAFAILQEDYSDIFGKENLFAEFGIANKKVGIGYKDPDFVLSWKITVGNSEYPYAVVSAINGEIIYVDDSIRTGIAEFLLPPDKLNNLIYWVVGIVIVLVLLILFLILRKKK
ncbi:hypothetical protein J4418_01920 [Candidatus Woesearchaeota archaeon]|nr:hypothetical protein [Candidatus Woesearchaeota archaeon]